MDIRDISIPEIYKESQDFRFFIEWFATALDKTKYDTENFIDLYDPLRCPEDLIWALCDTMGYKYDDRLPTSFNRLVLVYFMSMIYNRGSKDGITLAAETNLAQFNLLMQAQGYTDSDNVYHKPKEILYNRLEDTSIPVNSVYVTPYTDKGYIDVVYFSSKKPLDACIEYVRPVGMYLFQHSGVKFDARTKITVDARLTNQQDIRMSFGQTQVGHYSREDYARMQKTRQRLVSDYRIQKISNKFYIQNMPANTLDNQWISVFGPFNSESQAKAHFDSHINDNKHSRNPVWYSNSDYEGTPPDNNINPGYRALYSLQISNNDQIVQSLMQEPIFSLGYGPQDVGVSYPDDYLKPEYIDRPIGGQQQPAEKAWNLRYDRYMEEGIVNDHQGRQGNIKVKLDTKDNKWYVQDANGDKILSIAGANTQAAAEVAMRNHINTLSPDVYTVDKDRTSNIIKPRPAVNPIMSEIGDAISVGMPELSEDSNYDNSDLDNTKYTKHINGNIEIKDSNDL